MINFFNQIFNFITLFFIVLADTLEKRIQGNRPCDLVIIIDDYDDKINK